MATDTGTRGAVIRTERGLVVEGTRITLYDVMDYLRSGWPAPLVGDRLGLSPAQLDAAVEYINRHQREVEAEYAQVLREAEESRDYWESREREAGSNPPEVPGKDALRAKLGVEGTKQGGMTVLRQGR